MLQTVELQTSPSPTASIVWLHGLGADGYDFVPVVKELEALGAPAARYVFPHAPMRPVTINNGMTMRAWYDILGSELVRREDEGGVRESQRQVEELIAREVERGIVPSRIVLAGFSQGGAITLHTGLRQTQPLAGLLALSTYLPLAAAFESERAPQSQAVPILMVHGTQDPIIALDRATASRDLLRATGHPVKWQQYPMPHSLCAEEIELIAGFLRAVLS
jgi:phospholipase/carboxylesterase